LTNVINDDVQRRAFNVTLEGVTAIDTWVEQIGSNWGLSERTVFGARLCLAELAANVLEHGTTRSKDDQITITIDRMTDGIEVEFLDSCERFDPTAPQSLPEESDSGGGRGLLLLRAYARDLSYVADPCYNRTNFKIASA
jgi:anti-sigma regulatory factor (Ser/Thr protein kinase)